jgi:hypothetical protein
MAPPPPASLAELEARMDAKLHQQFHNIMAAIQALQQAPQ